MLYSVAAAFFQCFNNGELKTFHCGTKRTFRYTSWMTVLINDKKVRILVLFGQAMDASAKFSLGKFVNKKIQKIYIYKMAKRGSSEIWIFGRFSLNRKNPS